MAKILKAPGKYVQGQGELDNIGVHVKKIGTSFAVLLSENGRKRFEDRIASSLSEAGYPAAFFTFNGECSLEEIDRLCEEVGKIDCDCVIAVGGGKILDTGKAVAVKLDKAAVIVPTVASNDAPCSGLSVVYDDKGRVCKVIFSKHNPDLVLVDSEVIMHAPKRLLAAGIGDALATCYETRAAAATKAVNMVRGTATRTAVALSDTCLQILLLYGQTAIRDLEQGICSDALEDVIEATILLSGVGFESGGLAVAHAFHDSVGFLPETHASYHGEKVAFGTMVQLMLEHKKNGAVTNEELEKIGRFCKDLGLPVTLAEIGITEDVCEKVAKIAKGVCHPKQFAKNMPFPVSEAEIINSIFAADELGKRL
ncbi:MAG: glycerol dehydrogenase [Eubacteriales bacterium]|nr:glycerol dehydrogenase [Eubacteriales bacterium]